MGLTAKRGDRLERRRAGQIKVPAPIWRLRKVGGIAHLARGTVGPDDRWPDRSNAEAAPATTWDLTESLPSGIRLPDRTIGDVERFVAVVLDVQHGARGRPGGATRIPARSDQQEQHEPFHTVEP